MTTCWTRDLDKTIPKMSEVIDLLESASRKLKKHHSNMKDKYVYQKWVHAQERCDFLVRLLTLALEETAALRNLAGIRRRRT